MPELTPETDLRNDDLVQPFRIAGLNLRGRLVRLGPAVDRVVSAYPDPVARLLAETAALAVGLAGALKYDGVFTLQTSSDGPLRMMVADITSEGHLRAYAGFNEARLAAAEDAPVKGPVPRYLGSGHLAFTVDQGPNTERYQGIVELIGPTMAECAQHYFRQSEQLRSGIVLEAGTLARPAGAVEWRAGALMIQHLPDVSGGVDEEQEDSWRRALMLMSTVSAAELLDPALAPRDLLYRLFHEDGVRAYRPRPIKARCSCSDARAEATLKALPRGEVEDLKLDGKIVITCEFCKTSRSFDEDALAALFAA